MIPYFAQTFFFEIAPLNQFEQFEIKGVLIISKKWRKKDHIRSYASCVVLSVENRKKNNNFALD